MKKLRNLHKSYGTFIWECNKKKNFTNYKQKKINIKKRKNKNLLSNNIKMFKTIESKNKLIRIKKLNKNKKKKSNNKFKAIRVKLEKIAQ